MREPDPDVLLSQARRLLAPPGYVLPPGLTEGQLEEYERNAAIALPVQLRAWLRRVDGAIIGPGGVFGIEDFDELYQIFPEWRPRNWILVAGDGCGNYWVAVMGRDAETAWIGFVDAHEDPEAIASVAASTYLRFLHFLFAKELGDRRWPGDRAYVLSQDPDIAVIEAARQ